MNLTMVGKTLPVLISQVQEFIFDYNLERSINSTLNSQTNNATASAEGEGSGHEQNWNFPGLRKRKVQKTQSESKSRAQQPGIAEIVLLQQRTVLQVNLIILFGELILINSMKYNNIRVIT